MPFFAQKAFAITPHDSTNFANESRGIWVGGAGVVAVVFMDDSVVNITCVAGSFLPVRAKRVNSTNTTATVMTALL